MKRSTATAIISIVGGTLFHLGLLTVIRIESPVTRIPFTDPTAVRYVGNLDQQTEPSILQMAALNDTAPLFMPTRWNPVSRMADVASLKEATEIFESFPPQLRLPGFKPQSPMAPPSTDPGPELPGGPAFVLARYGRIPVSPGEGLSPGPTVRIQSLGSTSAPLADSTQLPAALLNLAPPALWTPVQFYLHVSDGFPAGLPVLAQSSGFVDWDRALQGFVASLDFYRQLGDGYYHLLVYP